MKVVFFGLGSIARRHIACLQALAPDAEIHAYRVVRNSAPPPGVTDIYRLSEVARNAYDIAFITNPTHLHINTATFAATIGIPNLFIEKPLGVTTDGLPALLEAIDESGVATYLAYPFRHHPSLDILIPPQSLTYDTYFIRCLTNMTSWHLTGPSSYSLSPSTGGGVILELSHELDLAVHLFGPIIDYGLDACFGTDGFPETARVRLDHGHTHGYVDLLLRGTTPAERTIIVGRMEVKYQATSAMYHAQMAYFLSHLGTLDMTNNVHSALPLFHVLADLHQQSIKRRPNTHERHHHNTR